MCIFNPSEAAIKAVTATHKEDTPGMALLNKCGFIA